MSHAAVDSPRSKDAVDWVSCFWYPLILQVPKKFKKERLITVHDSQI